MTTADRPEPAAGRRAAVGHAEVWHVSGDLAAHARSVPMVRRAIVDLLKRHGVPQAMLGKVGLAISEAATNVVLHAYPDRSPAGCLRYDADIGDGDLEVVISDDGDGVLDGHRSDGLGLGLHVIATVSDDFAINARTGGLEVWMRFILPPGRD